MDGSMLRRGDENRAVTPGKAMRAVDRFIPSRSALDLDIAHYNMVKENASNSNLDLASEVASPSKEEYKKQLASAFLSGENAGAAANKILAFKSKAPAPPAGLENASRGVYTANDTGAVKTKKTFRHVPSAPERILDAPELIDDYYLNLIDWGSSNQVAVALGGVVYLWNAESGDITQLMQTSPENEDDYVTSVQ